MLSYNSDADQIKIVIPVSGIEEIHSYRKGIMGILKLVEIDESDEYLKENLKSVYQLLNHLSIDKSVLFQHQTKKEETHEN
jgi:hypothetical protein